MTVSSSLKRCPDRIASLSPRKLLTAAAVLHTTACVLINLAGRFRLLPHFFDPNGISGAVAFDGFLYRTQAIELVRLLSLDGGLGYWLEAPLPFHLKLYSLSLAVLSPLFGFTMLSVEPLNLLYYLLTIILIFKLGAELFDRRAALLAPVIVAVWPSFLLHTTQLLRDPLFIVAMLTLLLVCVRWLTRQHSLPSALLHGLVGALACLLVWLTRSKMWMMFVGFVLLGAAFLVVRQLRERRWLPWNMATALLLTTLMLSIPEADRRLYPPDSFVAEETADAARLTTTQPPPSPCPDTLRMEEAQQLERPSSVWASLREKGDTAVRQLGEYRRKFIMFYPDAGANIDPCVRLSSTSDLLRYLPRAVANGLFAPYPNMWLGAGGTVGRLGRAISGLEMLGIYAIEALCVVCLFRERRRLPVWLLALVTLLGVVMLGLAVANVAVLFRLRYVFSMLLIVLGAGGAVKERQKEKGKR
jgi:Dolichyl-phosphate-mannose-protein mannosyltransferase